MKAQPSLTNSTKVTPRKTKKKTQMVMLKNRKRAKNPERKCSLNIKNSNSRMTSLSKIILNLVVSNTLFAQPP
jgi:hypothetical protein